MRSLLLLVWFVDAFYRPGSMFYQPWNDFVIFRQKDVNVNVVHTICAQFIILYVLRFIIHPVSHDYECRIREPTTRRRSSRIFSKYTFCTLQIFFLICGQSCLLKKVLLELKIKSASAKLPSPAWLSPRCTPKN